MSSSPCLIESTAQVRSTSMHEYVREWVCSKAMDAATCTADAETHTVASSSPGTVFSSAPASPASGASNAAVRPSSMAADDNSVMITTWTEMSTSAVGSTVAAFLFPDKCTATDHKTCVTIIATLLQQGFTSQELVVIAVVLLKRASLAAGRHQAQHHLSRANAKRALIAALHLAAKCYSDEYFTIATMCRVAGLSTTPEFAQMVGKCEMKLFAALDMNCLVSVEEYADMCRSL